MELDVLEFGLGAVVQGQHWGQLEEISNLQAPALVEEAYFEALRWVFGIVGGEGGLGRIFYYHS